MHRRTRKQARTRWVKAAFEQELTGKILTREMENTFHDVSKKLFETINVNTFLKIVSQTLPTVGATLCLVFQ
jgi:hypothetical protein